VKGLLVLLLLASCSDERALGTTCTTDCASTTIHPSGFLDPTSPAFHGAELLRRNWDFATCAACHGSDFKGGTAGVSCLTCHVDGPTACSTCHGPTGPTSFAHQAHAPTVTCGECHITPTSWDDDGHILHDGVAITGPVPVVFGARAALTLLPADRSGPPTFDGATCSNVYCHGAVLHDGGGTTTQPRWDDPTPVGACTGCHGAPPPTAVHVRSDCRACHPASAAHIDGIVEVGTQCNSCHGSAASIAPPNDLAGNMFTTAIGVGAHQAHLQASSRISAPIPCTTCHVVPTAIDSPGHIAPGNAPVTAALGWDHDAQTCSTSYCHGTATPRWTSSGQVSCGSCHGIPPADASHSPTMTLTSCASCHPGTVDAFGNIIVTNGESEHINGVVDHQ
jgi:predicted CxxxxCH...CXXCH cytochrome family protein